MEKNVPEMSVRDFCDFLCGTFDEEVIEAFYVNKISGKAFLKLSENHLSSLVSAIGDVLDLKELQERVRKTLQPLTESVSIQNVLATYVIVSTS